MTLAKSLLLPEALSKSELQQQFLDQTVEAISADGKTRMLYYFGHNGTLEKVVNDRLYKGRWKVLKSDRLCISIGDKKRKCRAVIERDNSLEQIIVKKNGNHRQELSYRIFHTGNQIGRLNKAPLLPATTLTSKQIKNLFSNHTVESVTVNKRRKSTTYYAQDGAVTQKRNNLIRTGTWQAQKSRICLQMENLKKKCRIIVKENGSYNKYIVKKNGHHQHSVSYIKFLPGNQL